MSDKLSPGAAAILGLFAIACLATGIALMSGAQALGLFLLVLGLIAFFGSIKDTFSS